MIISNFLIFCRAIPAAPSTLKLSCEKTNFRMTEPVMADITAKLHDDYGNFVVAVS